jgi:hypothetical protein
MENFNKIFYDEDMIEFEDLLYLIINILKAI